VPPSNVQGGAFSRGGRGVAHRCGGVGGAADALRGVLVLHDGSRGADARGGGRGGREGRAAAGVGLGCHSRVSEWLCQQYD
jgi:hypothetical protein